MLLQMHPWKAHFINWCKETKHEGIQGGRPKTVTQENIEVTWGKTFMTFTT